MDDLNAVETLKNRGVKFIIPPKDALDEWYRIARIASEKMIESGILPKDLVDQLDALLADFHSKANASHDQ